MEAPATQAIFSEALCSPPAAIAYSLSWRLAGLFPGRAIIEGDDPSFDLEAYVQAGHCLVESRQGLHQQIRTEWNGLGQALSRQPENAWFEVTWKGHSLEVILASWVAAGCQTRRYWIVADTRDVAEQFLRIISEWWAEVRGEVLVFDGGWWQKSEELFRAIKGATFENLVLRASLKKEIQNDLAQFFASRQTYEAYGVPWKRGILFIGPPGNGKTHAVKALINSLSQPCLYVKSFKSRYDTDHASIRAVFKRARQTTPCILVLEDLDSLVDGQNRTFFLNELDGFASNAGIVTLATSNHPERLDPAIVDRPSRFDRKYHFELPAAAERLAYITMWNEALQPALRLSDLAIMQIVELTEAFSFAYIKELFLSSTMRWIASPKPGGMQAVMTAQAATLREQMSSMNEEKLEELELDE